MTENGSKEKGVRRKNLGSGLEEGHCTGQRAIVWGPSNNSTEVGRLFVLHVADRHGPKINPGHPIGAPEPARCDF